MAPSSDAITASVALWWDRGVKKGKDGYHHTDLARQSGIDNLPFLVADVEPKGLVAVSHPADAGYAPGWRLVLSAKHLKLYFRQHELFSVDAGQLPDDWGTALRQRGGVFLLASPLAADPERVSIELESLVEDPDIEIGFVALEVAGNEPLPAAEIARSAAPVWRELANPLPRELPEQVPPFTAMTLRHMIEWGVIEREGLLAPVRVRMGTDNLAHSESPAPACQQQGHLSYQDLPLAEAIRHACPNCGYRADFAIATLPRFHSVGKLCRDIAEVIGGVALIEKPLTPDNPWPQLDAAAQLEQRLVKDYHYSAAKPTGSWAFSLAVAARRFVEEGAAQARLNPGIAVEAALVLNIDNQLREQSRNKLISADPARGEAALVAMEAATALPRNKEQPLLRAAHEVLREAAKRMHLLSGPLVLVLTETRGPWPESRLARLCALRYGYIARPGLHGLVMALPKPIAIALAEANTGKLVGTLWPGEDLASLSWIVHAESGRLSDYSLKKALDQRHLRDREASSDPQEPVGYRPFSVALERE